MKKITLLFASLFLVISVTQAAGSFSNSDKIVITNWDDNQEPVSFSERGITFYIFTDGQFDFNTESNLHGDIYYKSGRRNTNATFGTNGQNNNGGTIIEHDSKGKIRRVGNVFINYDFSGRIKRIGSVYVSYNRFAVSQIGGLRLIYNRFGQVINMVGSVKNSYNNVGSYNFGNSNQSYYGPANTNNEYNYNNNNNYQNGYNNNTNNDYFFRNNKSNNSSEGRITQDSTSIIIKK